MKIKYNIKDSDQNFQDWKVGDKLKLSYFREDEQEKDLILSYEITEDEIYTISWISTEESNSSKYVGYYLIELEEIFKNKYLTRLLANSFIRIKNNL